MPAPPHPELRDLAPAGPFLPDQVPSAQALLGVPGCGDLRGPCTHTQVLRKASEDPSLIRPRAPRAQRPRGDFCRPGDRWESQRVRGGSHCQVCCHVGLFPTHHGDLDRTKMGKLRLGGTDLPRFWSARVSGQGGFQVGTRPAPWLMSVCLCLCPRPHWAPAPGPHMMGGRPSARPALLAIHHQPAATGGMACLFCQLRVAPWGGG